MKKYLKAGLAYLLVTFPLAVWSSQVVAAAAKHEVSSLSLWLGIETAYFALQFALVGLAIGLVYGPDPREVSHGLQ